MAKTICRSFRYSGEVAGILEGYPNGKSLNEKFENIILHCFWELPKINKKIAAKRKEIAKLNNEIEQLRENKRQEAMEFDTLTSAKSQLSSAITKITIAALDYKEKLDKTIRKDLEEAKYE